MNEYTASNGTSVSTEAEDELFLVDEDEAESVELDPRWVVALREFFRGEDDERLGRWRWPENPNYVVYPYEDGDAAVLDERGPGVHVYSRVATVAKITTDRARAAQAYFDAHPEPKPAWMDAKHSEVWKVTLDTGEEFAAVVDTDGTDFPRFVNVVDDMSYGPRAGIARAVRIYPEVSS